MNTDKVRQYEKLKQMLLVCERTRRYIGLTRAEGI